MDINQIRKKLQQHQQRENGAKREKIDYAKIYFKPKEGKQIIRIVPSKFDKSNPFREIHLHYGFGKAPIMALTNYGENDPIVEFAKKLRQTGDKEDYFLSKKIEPKMRIIVPVIVRGEEDKGVRLWEIGKGVYMQLLGLADDEDYGDYTDIHEGRDFTVEGVKDKVANKDVIKATLRIKPKTSPITEDAELLGKILSEQPDIFSLYKKYEFDDLKDVLQRWLNPEEDDNDNDNVAPTPPVKAVEIDDEEEDEEDEDEVEENNDVSEDEDEDEGDLPWQNPSPKSTKPTYTLENKSDDKAKPLGKNTSKGKSKLDEFDNLFD